MDKELAAAQVFEDFLRTIIEKIHILTWSYLWVAYCDVQPNRVAGGGQAIMRIAQSDFEYLPIDFDTDARVAAGVLLEQTSGRL